MDKIWDRTPQAQAQREQFMDGFRAGCPVRDSEQGTVEDANTMRYSEDAEFQRGYVKGQELYQQIPESVRGIARK